jgi:hypothetical protein
VAKTPSPFYKLDMRRRTVPWDPSKDSWLIRISQSMLLGPLDNSRSIVIETPSDEWLFRHEKPKIIKTCKTWISCKKNVLWTDADDQDHDPDQAPESRISPRWKITKTSSQNLKKCGCSH